MTIEEAIDKFVSDYVRSCEAQCEPLVPVEWGKDDLAESLVDAVCDDTDIVVAIVAVIAEKVIAAAEELDTRV
jgi:hypothetical protein